MTRGVVDAAMPEPERATAVLPVEADQPVAGGIIEAEERDIPARRPLRLQIERAARSYVRCSRLQALSHVSARSGILGGLEPSRLRAAPYDRGLDDGSAVTRDGDARPGGEIAALEAIGERRGGAYLVAVRAKESKERDRDDHNGRHAPPMADKAPPRTKHAPSRPGDNLSEFGRLVSQKNWNI